MRVPGEVEGDIASHRGRGALLGEELEELHLVVYLGARKIRHEDKNAQRKNSATVTRQEWHDIDEDGQHWQNQ